MTTVASRLHALTGLAGATLAQHLAALVAGTHTVASALGAYSGLTGATMAQHLLVDRAAHVQTSGGVVFQPPRSDYGTTRRRRDEEALLLLGIL